MDPRSKEYYLKRKKKQIIKEKSFHEKLYENQKVVCPVCGGDLVEANWDEPLHIHHMVYRKEGGTNKVENSMLLHEECQSLAQNSSLKKSDLLKQLSNN